MKIDRRTFLKSAGVGSAYCALAHAIWATVFWESFEAAVKKSDASSVLVTHVVDRKSVTLNLPGTIYYRPVNFYEYYGRAQPMIAEEIL